MADKPILRNYLNQINLIKIKRFLLKEILGKLVFAFEPNRSMLNIKYFFCRA